MFFWLLLIGLVIYALVAKPGKRFSEWHRTSECPEDILTNRFINGEITEEEYKKMQKVINN